MPPAVTWKSGHLWPRSAITKKVQAFRPCVPLWNYPRTRVTLLTDNVLRLRQHPGMDSERLFFVTTVTAQRRPIFRREATAELLISTIAHYRNAGKFLLHEFVVMPDHVHLLITPAEEISLERAVQLIKGGFSFRQRSGSIWQSGFANHRVQDAEDYERHREYIWLNPVRARLVERAEEYRYSSAGGGTRLDPVPRGLKPHSSLAS
jgi:putative transposase